MPDDLDEIEPGDEVDIMRPVDKHDPPGRIATPEEIHRLQYGPRQPAGIRGRTGTAKRKKIWEHV